MFVGMDVLDAVIGLGEYVVDGFVVGIVLSVVIDDIVGTVFGCFMLLTVVMALTTALVIWC